MGIDRPAIYFPDAPFVLSHTGWPWVDEAVAMALKFPNVYLGTASYPPRHWPARWWTSSAGPAGARCIFGTNFPTVGHRHALDPARRAGPRTRRPAGLLGDNARSVLRRVSLTHVP